MKKPVTKNAALFWFIVAGIWLLTFCLDFLNPETQWFLYLLHGGCSVACLVVGIRSRIQYKKQQEEAE